MTTLSPDDRLSCTGGEASDPCPHPVVLVSASGPWDDWDGAAYCRDHARDALKEPSKPRRDA